MGKQHYAMETEERTQKGEACTDLFLNQKRDQIIPHTFNLRGKINYLTCLVEGLNDLFQVKGTLKAAAYRCKKANANQEIQTQNLLTLDFT